jgi:protein SCO1/2
MKSKVGNEANMKKCRFHLSIPLPRMAHGAAWIALVLFVLAAKLGAEIRWTGTACAQAIGTSGGTFELIDQNGKPFSSSALLGAPYAIFFGFTNCPDVCPTTLLEMSNNLEKLGSDGDRLKVVFVTVDPERDTPDQLHAYLSSFDRRIIGLSGSEEQIAAAAKGWNAFYNKLPESDGSYTIVHSAYVYLMDRHNHLVDTLGFDETELDQLEKLRKLVSDRSPD